MSADACYNIPIKEKSTTLAEECIDKCNADSSGALSFILPIVFLHDLAIRLRRIDISWIARRTLRHVLSGFICVRTPCRIDGNAGITDRALYATRNSFPRVIGGMKAG